MGTTITALLLSRDTAYLAHVGDSRAYLFRSGTLKQITTDHSYVAEQIKAGRLTSEQARTNPYRHIITRAVGIDREVAVDHATLPLQKNDTFLLCTDGLTGARGKRRHRRGPRPDDARGRCGRTHPLGERARRGGQHHRRCGDHSGIMTAQHLPFAAGTIMNSIPRLKDEYEIRGEARHGRHGHRVQGEQKSLDRPVAIKELKKAYHGDEQIVQRFEREAKTSASFQHENIVHIYDYWKKPDYCIVMEFVDGTDLAEILEKTGPLPVDVGVMIALRPAAP